MQTVLVISANRFFRESLLRLFRSDKELRVVGALEFSPMLDRQVMEFGPEIVALNPEPDDAAFSLARAIHEVAPEARILMIGMKDDRNVFLKAVLAGAVGYLLKDASPRRILAATHRVGRNLPVCPPHLVWDMFRVLAGPRGLHCAAPEASFELTPREQQLAALVARGLGNKEIAERLNLSLGTVKSHIHSILQKTQSKNRAEIMQVVAPRLSAADELHAQAFSLMAS